MSITPRNQYVSATNSGMLTTGADTLAGAKTFNSAPIISDASGIAAASASVPGIITTGAQTLAGAKTFNSPISSAGAKILAPWTTGTVYPIGSYVSYTVGTQTYAVVCQAAHTSGTYATDVGLGYWQMATPMKNYIINGGMDFWQRGTKTNYADTSLWADRWRMSLDSGAPATGIVNSYPVGSQAGPSSKNWMQVTSPASESGNRGIYQIMETNRLLYNKQISVSFWVAVSIGTGNFTIKFVDGTNRNGATFSSSTLTTYNNSWTKVTMTLPGLATETNSLLSIYWSGVNNQMIYISDVMLNEGPAPAAFQLAGGSIGGELALCQRYYEKSYSPDVVPGTITAVGRTMFRGATDNGPNIGGPIFYKVTKRYATTSISFWNSTTGAANTWIANQAAGTTTPTMNSSSEGVSGFDAFGTASTNWAAAVIYGHWAVDAEI
jgi:hypothetical protein